MSTVISWCVDQDPPDGCDPCAAIQAFCFNPGGPCNGRLVGANQPPNVPSTLQLYLRGEYIDPNTLIGNGVFINQAFIAVTPVVTIENQYNFYDGIKTWTVWNGGWSAAEGEIVAATGFPGKVLRLSEPAISALLGAPLSGNGSLSGFESVIYNTFLGTPGFTIQTAGNLDVLYYRAPR